MSLGKEEDREQFLGTEIYQYLISLQKKRRRQQHNDLLLAILLNKDKEQDIVEAVEESSVNYETKRELIDWLNKSGINKGQIK